jgi:hypothetical protein
MASGTHAADNYYYTAPVADFATTAYPWTAVTGCSLSFTPGSTTENWLVIATGQVRDSSTGEAQEAHVRLRVGGTVEAEGGVQSNPANAETGFFMMHRITGTTALQNIDVQAQDPFNNLTTTTVEQCSITAFRIPSNADFQWTEVDGAIGNCPDAGATILTHQFTPSSAGDYLYIVSFASFENPGGSTNKTWIDYPIAVTDAPDFNTEEAWSNGRDPRQTYVSIREEILPASLQTLSVVCDGSGGTAPDIDSTMRWAKVASFRLDAFEADYHDEDLTEVPLITSNVWTTHSTLTQAAPAGSREFIMLGTISGCTNDANPGPQHGMRFREDSTVQGDSVWGVNRDCGYTNGFHNSFQWVEPYTTASAKIWDNQYQSTDNLTEARFAESAIHVLQFPYSGIAFRSADSAGVASGNLTINKPTGTVQDDVMIGTIGVRPETVTITPPAGWTLVRRINNANANANSLAVYYKVAGASEPASYTWTISANTGVAGGIQTFSGVDTTNPIDVENGQNTPNGLDHATPSVDTTVDNAMLVTSHTFSSAATWTEPTGMTEGFDVLGGLQATEGNHVLQPTAGATGAKTATAAADADVGNAHILALRPATTGAATTTIGDGTSPGNKSVAQSSTNNAVDAFTLATDTGTDTVTALTVTFTGTDVNDVAASGVKIYEDNGGTANEWDATGHLRYRAWSHRLQHPAGGHYSRYRD